MTWVDGLAEWVKGDTAYLSVAFTWRVDDAYMRAVWYRAQGYRVRAGGPGLFTRPHDLAAVAEVGGEIPDAIVRHNPAATIASRGCPVGCWFCIVPAMEGREFTELPDFPVRPILCDNNLSALSPAYQEHIVRRYERGGVPLLDANSGFEPRTFTEEVFRRWQRINKGPWRFAYDDAPEGVYVEPVMAMLRRAGIGPRKIQVYTLIGNEPVEDCLTRIEQVIRWGGEPYAQPLMKLNAREKRPWVRFDWTEHELARVKRWVNRHYAVRGIPYAEYDASAKTSRLPPRQEALL
jgi:hypothetical protein